VGRALYGIMNTSKKPLIIFIVVIGIVSSVIGFFYLRFFPEGVAQNNYFLYLVVIPVLLPLPISLTLFPIVSSTKTNISHRVSAIFLPIAFPILMLSYFYIVLMGPH